MKRFPLPRRSLRLVLVLVDRGAGDSRHGGLRGASARRPHVHAEIRGADDEHRRRPGVCQELLRRPNGRSGIRRRRDVGHATEPAEQLRERGAFGRRQGRQLAGCTLEGAEQGDRARRRRHDADHLELRALQQLGLQPDHECDFRRPDADQSRARRPLVHREHVPGHARDGQPGQSRQGLGLFHLLDYRARRFAAPGYTNARLVSDSARLLRPERHPGVASGRMPGQPDPVPPSPFNYYANFSR